MILCAAFSALTDLKEDIGDSDAEDTDLDADDNGLEEEADEADEVYDGLGSALNWDETEFLSHGILPPYPVSRLP